MQSLEPTFSAIFLPFWGLFCTFLCCWGQILSKQQPIWAWKNFLRDLEVPWKISAIGFGQIGSQIQHSAIPPRPSRGEVCRFFWSHGCGARGIFVPILNPQRKNLWPQGVLKTWFFFVIAETGLRFGCTKLKNCTGKGRFWDFCAKMAEFCTLFLVFCGLKLGSLCCRGPLSSSQWSCLTQKNFLRHLGNLWKIPRLAWDALDWKSNFCPPHGKGKGDMPNWLIRDPWITPKTGNFEVPS